MLHRLPQNVSVTEGFLCRPSSLGKVSWEKITLSLTIEVKDTTLKDELPRSVGAQYATGDQRRNNSRKNGEMEPKQKQHPVVGVTGDKARSHTVKSKIA